MTCIERHSILVAKQRAIRDMLLRAARRNEPNRVALTAYADDCEETAELIILLETEMRTANAAVTAALDALALAKQSATDRQTAVDAAVKSALDKAKVDGLLSDEVTARLNADVPPPAEPVAPVVDGQQP